MRQMVRTFVGAAALAAILPTLALAQPPKQEGKGHAVQLGPRPFFLVDDMDDGPLKRTLQKCSGGSFFPSKFSIGHRGAALQFPSIPKKKLLHRAAARQGAGILECDVAVTQDGEFGVPARPVRSSTLHHRYPHAAWIGDQVRDRWIGKSPLAARASSRRWP